MEWPLMTEEEIHEFGVNMILSFLPKEGVTIESVTRDPKMNPQIVGKRWESLAFIYVRTAVYPYKGELTPAEFNQCLAWARQNKATAFFASVGIACMNYPDKTPVTDDAVRRLPIRHGGFAVSYPGLVVMATSDKVMLF